MRNKHKFALSLLHLSNRRFSETRLLLALFLFFFITFSINGQGVHFDFVNLTKDDGLTSDSYNSFVFKDSRGYVWISSMEGVNVFNGTEIKNFKPDPDKPGSMKGKNIQSNFFEDGEGNIWFTTYQALNCFVFEKQLFESYQVTNDDEEKIGENYHAFHFEKNRELLWLKAGKEIFYFNTNTQVYKKIPFVTNGTRFTVDTLSTGEVNLIIACPWKPKSGVELFRFEQKEWTYEETELGSSLDLRTAGVSQAILDKREPCVWLISDKGLISFELGNSNNTQLYPSSGDKEKEYKNGVFIAKHQLLLSTESNGLVLFNTATRKIVRGWMEEGEEEPDKISSLSSRELYLIDENVLWISNKYKGVSYSKVTKAFFQNPIEKILENPTSVHFLAEDKNGQIWVSSSSKELFVFDLQGKLINRFPYAGTAANDLNIEKVIGIEKDKEGDIWVLGLNVIYKYDDEKGWQKILKKNGLMILSMTQTNAGKILISTYDGVKELIEDESGYKLIPSISFEDYQGFGFYYLYQNNADDFFVPYNSNEVWIGKENNASISFSNKIKIDADVYGFSFFNNKAIAGTSNGLIEINENHTIELLNNSERAGGASLAYRPVVDDNGNVWFGNNKGLGFYDLKDNSSFLFKKEDGLPEESFNYYAAIKASDGKIWMGNRKGVVVFDPDSVVINRCAPEVQIEEFLVNNKPAKIVKKSKLDWLIELGYNENNLAIKSAGIDCFNSEEVKIYYNINDSKNTRFEIANNSFLRLEDLSPKTYDLEIFALNSNKVKSLVKKIKIKIEPPFWQKLWFQLLSIVCLFLIGYGIIQIYVQKKLRAQKLELTKITAQQDERNRIADELHDDLGAGLSIIRFLTEELLSEANKPGVQKKLKKVSHSSKELLTNMREIVWALDTSNNTLRDLYKQIRSYASEYLTVNRKEFEINIEERIEAKAIRGERRRNIFLIVKESLHNVIKHAEATKVEVEILVVDQQLVVKVKDNGKGIDPDEIVNVGRGVRSMRKRAAAIDAQIIVASKVGKGTTITLRLSEKNYY